MRKTIRRHQTQAQKAIEALRQLDVTGFDDATLSDQVIIVELARCGVSYDDLGAARMATRQLILDKHRHPWIDPEDLRNAATTVARVIRFAGFSGAAEIARVPKLTDSVAVWLRG